MKKQTSERKKRLRDEKLSSNFTENSQTSRGVKFPDEFLFRRLLKLQTIRE